ncbi:MAG: AsmA family protein, partial [Nitrospiraceae bacterium]
MHILKSILVFLGYFLLLCTTIASILLVTLEDEDYRGILAWTIEHYTDYKVSINGPLSVDLSIIPALTLVDVRIEPDRKDVQPLSAHIGHVRIKIALKQLLTGAVLVKALLVKDVTLSYVDEDRPLTEPDEETDFRQTLADINIPVLESVSLQNIDVTFEDKESDYILKVHLDSFTIDAVRDTGPLSVTGSGTLNNTDFSVDGQLGSVPDAIRHAQPYPIDLGLSITDLNFRISGTVDDPLEGKGLNIHVSADEAELSNMLEVLKADIPWLGSLDFDAHVTGDIESPSVSDFRLNITGKPQIELLAKGSIMNLLTGEGTDIAVSGLTSHEDLIQLLLPEDLHSMNEIELGGTLLKSEGDYLLRDVGITLREAKAAALAGVGNILIGKSLFDPENSKFDLRLSLEAKNTQLLKSILFDGLPDTGPVNGKARLIGPLIDPELKDI